MSAVTPYYTTMTQADLDAFVAMVDTHGVRACLGALADFITQRGYGDGDLSLMVGASLSAARSFEDEDNG